MAIRCPSEIEPPHELRSTNLTIMYSETLVSVLFQVCPAFDFLDIPTRNPTRILQDHGRLSRKSRTPTRKFRNPGDLPGNPGIISSNLPEFSGCTARFSRTFQDFPGSFKVSQDCFLKS